MVNLIFAERDQIRMLKFYLLPCHTIRRNNINICKSNAQKSRQLTAISMLDSHANEPQFQHFETILMFPECSRLIILRNRFEYSLVTPASLSDSRSFPMDSNADTKFYWLGKEFVRYPGLS